MLCCERCFESETLTKRIQKNGQKGDCDFCTSKNVMCLAPIGLFDLFERPLHLFEKSSTGGKPLSDLFEYEYGWPIFKNSSIDRNRKKEFWRELCKASNDPHVCKEPIDLDALWIVRSELSPSVQWHAFSRYLKTERRFFVDLDKFNLVFDWLKNPPKEIIDSFHKGRRPLYRACIEEDDEDGYKCEELERRPPSSKTPGGRANPVGIPFLYLADHVETAIAEVRPWKGAKVHLGKFEVEELIILLKLIEKPGNLDPFAENGDPIQKWARYDLMGILKTELSKPIDYRKANTEYLPSQFLVEFIRSRRHQQFDGVLYQSGISPGCNVVLFDNKKVKLVDRRVTTVDGLSVKIWYDDIVF